MSAANENWSEANQQSLMIALSRVRERIQSWLGKSQSAQATQPTHPASGEIPFTLETICNAFGLSPFERDMLLLCAGPNLDSGFAALVAECNGDPRKTSP